MKRVNVLWVILDLVFLVIFNVLFFLLSGFQHIASVWISYAFIHFAYLMLLLTPKLIRAGKSYAVFGFSVYSISSVYFILEFITGIILILITPESCIVSFIIQLCIAGLYGIILVAHLIANEGTATAEEKRQPQISFIKDNSAKIKVLLDNIKDKETKKNMERLYDAFYSSPAKSHPNMMEIEDRILASVNELERAVSNGDKESTMSMANSLLSLINERNNLLKSFH